LRSTSSVFVGFFLAVVLKSYVQRISDQFGVIKYEPLMLTAVLEDVYGWQLLVFYLAICQVLLQDLSTSMCHTYCNKFFSDDAAKIYKPVAVKKL